MCVAGFGRGDDDGGEESAVVDRSADGAGTRGTVMLQLTVWEQLL
jgi:hypothetical protein